MWSKLVHKTPLERGLSVTVRQKRLLLHLTVATHIWTCSGSGGRFLTNMPFPLPVRWLALLLATSISLSAQAGAAKPGFPDVAGFKTLKCDFHLHTSFSDGQVWPTIRVEEALRDNLDAIAITDHLEKQPNAADIPNPDRNRANEIAQDRAKGTPLIVIAGAEITRDMPPGHANVLFLRDVNALLKADALDVYREAAKQGAFVFWNHPSWLTQAPDGNARVSDLHRRLFEEKLVQGIEVTNDQHYSDSALQIALDHRLTILGNSDIHGLNERTFATTSGGHRPVNLVFARERSEAAIKEAVLAGRTVVWFKESLIGRAEWLVPLLTATLTVGNQGYAPGTSVLRLTLTNQGDADLILRNVSQYEFDDHADVFVVKAHQSQRVSVKTGEKVTRFELPFEVLNAVTAPRQHATVPLVVTPP